MSSAAQEISKIIENTTENDPFHEALLFAFALAKKIEISLPDVIPSGSELFGRYNYDGEKFYPSTTGTVFSAKNHTHEVVFKGLFLPDQTQGFKDNHHHVYPFENPLVAATCLLGENAACNYLNADADKTASMHHGIGNLYWISTGEVGLGSFNLPDILAGKAVPVMVMKKMDQSLLDKAYQAQESGEEGKLAQQCQNLVDILFKKAIHLEDEPELAELIPQLSTLDAVRKKLAGTPGWLAGRQETWSDPLNQAKADTANTIAIFDQFLDLPITDEQLKKRAQNRSYVFCGGDSKLGNIFAEPKLENIFDEELHFSDQMFLIARQEYLRNLNPGQSQPAFAPWAFGDIMEQVAYLAIEPYALGLNDVYQAIKDQLKSQMGGEWSDWHELYFELLVAYKLLVESACGVDNYLSYFDSQAGKKIKDMPKHTRTKIETYPKKALELAGSAWNKYLAATRNN